MGCIDNLKLYIFRLKLPGDTEQINYSINPEHLREKGEEQLLSSPIKVQGSLGRIDNNQWLLSLKLETQLGLFCPVCNNLFLYFVCLPALERLISHDEVSSGIFDCKPLIRQELLLESDRFQECSTKGCPERKNILKFLEDRKKHQRNNPFEYL
ncbi:hypothetical protein C10C_0933 [Chlamydia serpentis]|uniref:Uncharacterized protein n=1 Tax=Chlamydia serpentis TaxID=1967782 RepID=A0A2R8FCS5_9CHLA|nr:hypothetical protein [Chlamydia serpentis]SPN74067.1 hypothetical protein C10C_0933 [Chlamydia serpentis]